MPKAPRVLEPASGLVGLERIGPLAIHALTGPLSLAADAKAKTNADLHFGQMGHPDLTFTW